jgi:hypothetical protein
MEEVGKLLIYFGLALVVVGLVLTFAGKLSGSLPIGRLPGDILIKRDNFVFYFPLGTSLLLSLLLSLFSFLIFSLLSRK